MRASFRKKQSQASLKACQAPVLSSTLLSSYQKSVVVPWINNYPSAFLTVTASEQL